MICKYNVYLRLFFWIFKYIDFRKVCELFFVLFFVDYVCFCILLKIFSVNNDWWIEVKYQIEFFIMVVVLCFYLIVWSGDMCMRVEVFGCDGEYIVICCLLIVMYFFMYIQGGF